MALPAEPGNIIEHGDAFDSVLRIVYPQKAGAATSGQTHALGFVPCPFFFPGAVSTVWSVQRWIQHTTEPLLSIIINRDLPSVPTTIRESLEYLNSFLRLL